MSRRSVATMAVAMACAAAFAGCVEHRMVIRSQPEGARVILDLEEIESRTPTEVPFEWSGTREVILIAPGYRVFEGHAELEDRWYSYFPLDFVAEVLYPGTIHDVQEFEFELEPYYPEDEPFTSVQEEELESRLAALRERADAHRSGGSAGPGGDAVVLADGRRVSTAADADAEPPRSTSAERDVPDQEPAVAPTKPGAPLPPPRAPRSLVRPGVKRKPAPVIDKPKPADDPPPPPPPARSDR